LLINDHFLAKFSPGFFSSFIEAVFSEMVVATIAGNWSLSIGAAPIALADS
jgi:hypothetical protein